MDITDQTKERLHSKLDFDRLVSCVTTSYATTTSQTLFETDARSRMFDIYLSSMPEDERQQHNCRSCRIFLERYGHLTIIDSEGKLWPAMWMTYNVVAEYNKVIEELAAAVRESSITGVFASGDSTWGRPVTGEWHHLSVANNNVHSNTVVSADQWMAEKSENFLMLRRSMEQYSLPVLNTAQTILAHAPLAEAEKFHAMVTGFRNMQLNVQSTKDRRKKDAFVWKYAAEAPTGFCHIKSSMIGPLLDDIQSGMSVDDITERFNAKMHPLKYQRPQVAPTSGNIKQAEDIIAKMGLAPSLQRRFARLEDLQAIWWPVPTKPTETPASVLGGIVPKDKQPTTQTVVNLPSVTMTWVKFRDQDLREANRIEILPPYQGQYVGMLTAANMDAPPILHWDLPDRRNPASWFVFHPFSTASDWGIQPNVWATVDAITYDPASWFSDNQPTHAFFVIHGAKDHHHANHGIGLFPSFLKAELHSVRATIEAYSNKERLTGYQESSANGISLSAGNTSPQPVHLRIHLPGGAVKPITIDRWD